MVQLVLIYCLASNASACVERRPVLDDVLTPVACMISAQVTAAEFLAGHPAYRLESYKCEIGKRAERAA